MPTPSSTPALLASCFTVVLVLALGAGQARADALGGCPQGQHFVANPVPPGAMHHGGGQCVDDAPPPGHHCDVATPGAGRTAGTTAVLAALVLAACVGVRRRR